MANSLRVLLPAKEIPVGSRVTKRSGDKLYTLRKDLKVFFPGDQVPSGSKTIKADLGVVFLVNSETGDATALAETTELLWHVSRNELRHILNHER